jgi:transposase
MVKLMYWDTDGFMILFKRLERGRFNLPDMADRDAQIDRCQLSMLLEGITPKKVSKRYIFRG